MPSRTSRAARAVLGAALAVLLRLANTGGLALLWLSKLRAEGSASSAPRARRCDEKVRPSPERRRARPPDLPVRSLASALARPARPRLCSRFSPSTRCTPPRTTGTAPLQLAAYRARCQSLSSSSRPSKPSSARSAPCFWRSNPSTRRWRTTRRVVSSGGRTRCSARASCASSPSCRAGRRRSGFSPMSSRPASTWPTRRRSASCNQCVSVSPPPEETLQLTQPPRALYPLAAHQSRALPHRLARTPSFMAATSRRGGSVACTPPGARARPPRLVAAAAEVAADAARPPAALPRRRRAT